MADTFSQRVQLEQMLVEAQAGGQFQSWSINPLSVLPRAKSLTWRR